MPDSYTALIAHQFSYKDLADIYNQTRVDYIVPMPMNERRMEEYITSYDVSLAHSIVALDDRNTVAAVGMLGLRGERAWVTRLGVMPDQRKHGIGRFIVEMLLQHARQAGAHRVQLEVIDGNEPAIRLFYKLGFAPLRSLRVIRRPPMPPPALAADICVTPLTDEAICTALVARTDTPSWIDENRSLMHVGSIQGLDVRLPDGRTGQVVFRAAVFQLSHFVLLGDETDDELTHALLSAAHARYASWDTKIENLPVDSPRWPVFQSLGYVDTFQRIEMLLTV